MANEELEKKHEGELSVQHYTFKKIREAVISLGGTFGGMMLGGWIGGKTGNANAPKTISFPEGYPLIGGKSYTKNQTTGGFVGFMVGSLVAGAIIAYEHWRKVETQRLAVDEINKDIANTEAIMPIDRELVSENKRLRGMLEELEAKRGHHHKVIEHGPKSHHDHAERSATEHSRV